MAFEARILRFLVPAQRAWCLCPPDIWRDLVLLYGKHRHLLSFNHCPQGKPPGYKQVRIFSG
jgi:hypothetical protein